jgi:hypothetical protein
MPVTLPAHLPATEFSPDFVDKMMNRMSVSYHKYGPLADGFPAKVDAVESLKKRLEKYAETGNTEWLVDAANFAMIEFMRPRHPAAHFQGTDSHASPGRVTTEGKQTRKANDEIG